MSEVSKLLELMRQQKWSANNLSLKLKTFKLLSRTLKNLNNIQLKRTVACAKGELLTLRVELLRKICFCEFKGTIVRHH